MKKFIAMYHAAPEAMEQMATATPEQKAEGMKHWMAWQARIGASLVDMGAPLMGGTALSPSGNKAASIREVSGFSIVQAEDTAAAHALFDNHPHLHWHPTATIEVHEFVEM